MKVKIEMSPEEMIVAVKCYEELKAYRATGYTPEQVQELHDKHWSECRQIALYSDELDKYKRLLNLAISDIRGCDKCAHGEQADKWHRVYTCKCKKFDGAGGYVGAACDHFRWVHADEVEEYLSARPD